MLSFKLSISSFFLIELFVVLEHFCVCALFACLILAGITRKKITAAPKKQSRADIEHRLQSRILLVRRRHNDIIILHLAVGKCVFQLSARYPPCRYVP